MSRLDKNHILIDRLVLGPYQTNAYIVTCARTKASLVIDAPARPSVIIKGLRGTSPRYILLTHDHDDHTGALKTLRLRLHVPLGAHAMSISTLSPPPELTLTDGDILSLGNLKIEVRHTPGHTPGSLCFRVGQFLFAGDTIFPGGPGHTERVKDFQQILKAIREKILPLPEDTIILPGHGEATTVKEAKEGYSLFSSRPHDPLTYGDVTWTA